MKPVADKRLEELEEISIEGARQIRKLFVYQGSNRRDYLENAKIGAAMISSYARLRASETNRMAIEQKAKRGE